MRSTLLLLLLLLPLAQSCSRPVSVGLEGDTQPTFVLAGDGKLWGMEVYEIRSGDDGGQCFCLVWRIDAISETLAAEGRSADDIKTVRYGVAPEGFEQTYPARGAPPPIIPERHYEYRLQLKGGNEVRREFGVVRGRATHTLME